MSGRYFETTNHPAVPTKKPIRRVVLGVIEDGDSSWVAKGGYPPKAPTDPDMPNSGIRLFGSELRCAPELLRHAPSGAGFLPCQLRYPSKFH